MINLEELDQPDSLEGLQSIFGRIDQLGVAATLFDCGEGANEDSDAAGVEQFDVTEVEDNPRISRAQGLGNGAAEVIDGIADHEVATHADDLHVAACIFADLYFHIPSGQNGVPQNEDEWHYRQKFCIAKEY